MFCSIRHYDGCTNVKELVRRIEQELLPEIRDMEGLVEYRLIDCGDDDSVVSISMFGSEDEADDANEQIAEIIKRQSLTDLLPNAATITLGDVVIDNRK